MLTEERALPSLYVDRHSQQWIVRDPDGRFWVLPLATSAWDDRQPYEASADSELESIPRHYKYLLHLPF
jgi:hypothetical protein